MPRDVEIIEINGGLLGSELPDLVELLRSFVRGSPRYNLASAHFNFDPTRYIPSIQGEQFMRDLDALPNNLGKSFSLRRPKVPDYFVTLEDSLRAFVDESGIDQSRFNLTPLHGTTRDSLETVFRAVRKRGKGSIAMPLPNWHFWNLCDSSSAHGSDSCFFEAKNPDQLVTNFGKLAREGTISGLVLVDPSNPLGYRITQEEARDINEIAMKYKVDVIVDDVLRGTRQAQDRSSIAQWFDKPLVVEGFTKRFGEDPRGVGLPFSYVLTPKGSRVKIPRNDPSLKESYAAGTILKLISESVGSAAVEELEARNQAFDRSFLSRAPSGMVISRPYASSLTSVLALPEDYPSNAAAFANLASRNGVDILPIASFYPTSSSSPGENSHKLRFTVGNHSQSELESAAEHLAKGLIYCLENPV